MGKVLLTELDQEKPIQDLSHGNIKPGDIPEWTRINVGMEKEMAPHSSNLAWKIPWVEEAGRLQSMGSQKFRHD